VRGDAVNGSGDNAWKKDRYEQDLADARQAGFVVGVQWNAVEWSCEAGKQKAGCYRLEDAPTFETPGCDFEERETQCCCWWVNLFEGSEPPAPWRK
jgi:hypothetical protein